VPLLGSGALGLFGQSERHRLGTQAGFGGRSVGLRGRRRRMCCQGDTGPHVCMVCAGVFHRAAAAATLFSPRAVDRVRRIRRSRSIVSQVPVERRCLDVMLPRALRETDKLVCMAYWRVPLVGFMAVFSACSEDGSTPRALPDGSAGSSGGALGSAGSGGSGGIAGSGGVAGSLGSGGTGGSAANSCPASPPTPGRDCPIAVSTTGCSYGDSVLPECRDRWQCQCVSAHPGVQCSWISGNLALTCAPADAAACPATAPMRASDGGLAACSAAVGTRCGYPDGTICGCTSCLEMGGPCQPVNPPRWSCSSPPSDANCPRTIPNAGGSCTRAGLECVYDAGCGISARCENMRWTWTQQPCPQ
jgi:hypothetical protein